MNTFNEINFDKGQNGIPVNLHIGVKEAGDILGIIGNFLLKGGSINNLSFIDAYNIGCDIAKQLNPSLSEFPVLAVSSFMLVLKTRLEESKTQMNSQDINDLCTFLEIINIKLVPVQLVSYLKLNSNDVKDYIFNQLNKSQITATVIDCIHYEIFGTKLRRPLDRLEIKAFVENLLAAIYYVKSGVIKVDGWKLDELNWRISKLQEFYQEINRPSSLPELTDDINP